MDNLDNDNFFGKRAKAKRRARRAARKAGMSRKEARGQGRLAKRKVKQAQLLRRGKTKRAARVIARGTKSGLKIVLQNAALAPLLPLRRAMTKALKKRGLYNEGMGFPDLVNVFFNNVISKKGNKASKYDEIADNYIASHPSANMYLEDIDGQEEYDNFIGAIGSVVSAIINFFKKKKNERQAKKEMTPEDKMLGEEAIIVEEQLLNEASNAQPITRADINNATGSEKRALRKLFRSQKKGGQQGGLGNFGNIGGSQPQTQNAGFLGGLGNILGGIQNRRQQQQMNQGFGNQGFRNQVIGGRSMIPKIIGAVAFIVLAFVIFKKVGQ